MEPKIGDQISWITVGNTTKDGEVHALDERGVYAYPKPEGQRRLNPGWTYIPNQFILPKH